MTTEFNAAAARAAANAAKSLNGIFMRKETDECIEYIKKASEKGLESTTLMITHHIVADRLRALGFKVSVTFDQRDGDYMEVKW